MSVVRMMSLGLCAVGVAGMFSGCPGGGAAGPTDGGILSGRWTSETSLELEPDVFFNTKLTYVFSGENEVTVEFLQEVVEGNTAVDVVNTFTGTFAANAVEAPEEEEAKAQRAGSIVFNAPSQAQIADAAYEALFRAISSDLSSDEAEVAVDLLNYDGNTPFEFPEDFEGSEALVQLVAELVSSTDEVEEEALGCNEEGGCAQSYQFEPHHDFLSIGDNSLFRE